MFVQVELEDGTLKDHNHVSSFYQRGDVLELNFVTEHGEPYGEQDYPNAEVVYCQDSDKEPSALMEDGYESTNNFHYELLKRQLEVGDFVEVESTKEVPSQFGWETNHYSYRGQVVAMPSRQFDHPRDDVDFDFRLVFENGKRGTVMSVDLTKEQVLNLHYDAGGDRDWDTEELVSVVKVESP